ncbi:hypothetical protein, partial [Undibacterium oligocarboniphilum]|uniref:hypothetical protein n=1 Tax=Undibacterium oligocarboniphilum TaxID=666702 RepID=UPI001C409A57
RSEKSIPAVSCYIKYGKARYDGHCRSRRCVALRITKPMSSMLPVQPRIAGMRSILNKKMAEQRALRHIKAHSQEAVKTQVSTTQIFARIPK